MLATELRFISRTCFVLSLAAFLALHFLNGTRAGDPPQPGWKMWPRAWQFFEDPSRLNVRNSLALGTVFAITLIVLSAPFLGSVWRRSFLAWSSCTLFSGVAAASMWYQALSNPMIGISPVMYWLITAASLNFIGLLLARAGVSRRFWSPGRPESF